MILNRKSRNYIIAGCFLFFLFSTSILGNLITPNSIDDAKTLDKINYSGEMTPNEIQWLNNPTFTDSVSPWYESWEKESYKSDINATEGNDNAKFDILGNKGNISFYANTSDPNELNKWTTHQKDPWTIYPHNYDKTSDGFYVSHYWDEGVGQDENTPAIRWKRNITLDRDISDYKIISASINSVINATVQDDPLSGGGIEVPADNPSQGESLDYSIFTVEIADMEENYKFQIAKYELRHLGEDGTGTGTPSLVSLYTPMNNTVDSEILKSYLRSVIAQDQEYRRFKIILGIDIYCADNYSNEDVDNWESLFIKSLNLSFSYEKTINEGVSASWNQDAGKISDITIENSTFTINKAFLNISYMTNLNWSKYSSNSEIRIFVNEFKHNAPIELTEANSTFQTKSLDIAYLINDEINISIQLYIADEFELNNTYNVFIDNVTLEIEYTVYFDDYTTKSNLYLDNEDITGGVQPDPIPIGRNFSLILYYLNESDGHIPNATVTISGDFIGTFNETRTGGYYYINISTRDDLDLGDNELQIEASKKNYETRAFTKIVEVQKIDTEIVRINGPQEIRMNAGENLHLQIILNDTDNNELIKGATITYAWDKGSGVLMDPDDDGIYEAMITDFPSGAYTITINAISQGDYDFKSFYLIITSIAPEPFNFFPIVIGLGIAIIGLSGYFILYQTRLKYPPVVRKLRKIRKKISKGKTPKSMDLLSRQNSIGSILKKKVELPGPEPEKAKAPLSTAKKSKNNKKMSNGGK